MPLLDHFHSPLRDYRQWQGFHSAWATMIAAELNRLLPATHHAEPHVHFGVEIDVAAMEKPELIWDADAGGKAERAAVEAALAWEPPAPTATVPLPAVTDIVEVRVLNPTGEAVLAAALELVSPANKDRTEHREAFVEKCLGYLREGVGLVVIDIVTERLTNLHDEMMDRLGGERGRIGAGLYAVAYHPVQREGEAELDLWTHVLTLGAGLPTLPVWLKGGLSVPVDLELTYQQTCGMLRIPTGTMRAAQ